MKAAGLDPIRMRKGSWNAKAVHLVAILSIYTLGASLSAKVRTFLFRRPLLNSLWHPFGPHDGSTGIKLACEMRSRPNCTLMHMHREMSEFSSLL